MIDRRCRHPPVARREAVGLAVRCRSFLAANRDYGAGCGRYGGAARRCPARKRRGRTSQRLAWCLACVARRAGLDGRIADAPGARRRMRGGGLSGYNAGADRQAARLGLRSAAARAAWLLDLYIRRSVARGSRPLDSARARDSERRRDRQDSAAAVVRRLPQRHRQLRIVGTSDGFRGPRGYLSRRLLP